MTYLVPVIATLIGVVVLGERLRWFQPAGATLVLLGVAMSHSRAADRNRGRSSGQSSSLRTQRRRWRDIPEEYGPWGRVYDLFRRWQRDGTWQQIFTALLARADAQALIAWDLNVDSTVCRAHQHAAGHGKGSCKRSPPAASPSSPSTTGSDARAAA